MFRCRSNDETCKMLFTFICHGEISSKSHWSMKSASIPPRSRIKNFGLPIKDCGWEILDKTVSLICQPYLTAPQGSPLSTYSSSPIRQPEGRRVNEWQLSLFSEKIRRLGLHFRFGAIQIPKSRNLISNWFQTRKSATHWLCKSFVLFGSADT